MDSRGIKYVHIVPVDNLLTKPCDPFLIGMLRGIDGQETSLDVACKSMKVEKGEKCGRFAIG